MMTEEGVITSTHAEKGRTEFAQRFAVSRETMAKFDTFLSALHRAQSGLNLIAPSTLDDPWTRHFADSAQLQVLGGSPWLDIGSGAGLPGVVLAILGEHVEMIDARAKKVVFIQSIIDHLDLTNRAKVFHARIEGLQTPRRTIVARALAPITKIFDWTTHIASPDTKWVLPKGRSFDVELAEAERHFRFKAELVDSVTSAESRIVLASSVKRR